LALTGGAADLLRGAARSPDFDDGLPGEQVMLRQRASLAWLLRAWTSGWRGVVVVVVARPWPMDNFVAARPQPAWPQRRASLLGTAQPAPPLAAPRWLISVRHQRGKATRANPQADPHGRRQHCCGHANGTIDWRGAVVACHNCHEFRSASWANPHDDRRRLVLFAFCANSADRQICPAAKSDVSLALHLAPD
jgi:hypothetical protein